MNVKTDSKEIRDTLSLLLLDGQITELRALEVRSNGYTQTWNGYYDDPAALARDASRLSGQAKGLYIIPNPVKPELLARAKNRARAMGKSDASTSDSDILCRRWLLIDCDAVRPSGISASETEHQSALRRADEIRDALSAEGWPLPIYADSGNGGHLLYRVDLPTKDDGLIKRVLSALAFRFDDRAVKVDQSVFNPARIWKLYGTLCCKGDSLPDRPHRVGRMIEVPDTTAVVGRELLEGLASSVPAEAGCRKEPSNFDLSRWIVDHSLPVSEPEAWNGGQRWVFPVCPWNASHTNGSAYIVQFANGGIAAGCHHNSCAGNDWHKLRLMYEPDAYTVQAVVTKDTAAAKTFPTTDMGNSERLIHYHGDDIRYVSDWKTWIIWNGVRWEVDSTLHIERLAKDTVRKIYGEAEAVQEIEKRRELAKWAVKSESCERIAAMVRLAQSSVTITSAELDQNPYLICCQNGVVDLLTGEYLEPMRHNYMTKQIPVKYEPSAECPQWIKFLERVQPESDSRDYLQKAAGYSLTADVSEQCLFFLYGEGQNGKTTFVEVLQKLMGSYYKKTNIDTLMVKRNSAIRDDVASLAGARLVCTSEISEGQRLAEGMVKDMTGGDTLTARYLYGKEFSFKAGFKLWMYGNHKPTIGGKDDGIWRRIRLIPFEVQIPDSDKDGHLPEKLEGELSGILNWALLGCKKWRREGLSAPDTIRGAVNEYRREQDTLAEFLEDCCISGGKYKVAKKLLWNAYEEWAADNEDRFDSKRSFNKEIQRRPNIHSGNGTGNVPEWRGIGLKAEYLEAAMEVSDMYNG